MRVKFWTLALCGCLFAGTGMAAAPSYAPQVGEAHPNFVLPQIDTRAPATTEEALVLDRIAMCIEEQ